MITVRLNAPRMPASQAYQGACRNPAQETDCLVASTYAAMAAVPTAKETSDACNGLPAAAPSFALNAPFSGIAQPATKASAIQNILSMTSFPSRRVVRVGRPSMGYPGSVYPWV